MSTLPKYSQILIAIEQRLQLIGQSSGYYTDIGQSVFLDMRPPQIDEIPCCMVWADERVVESNLGCNSRCDMLINVMGYAERKDRPLLIGDELQSDIQRAVELEDNTLGGLLRGQYGLAFQSSEIFMPEIGTDAVGARVTYTAPHIRVTGDPEIT